MQAIVLAGGRGERLRAIVSGVPKPMAPIADRPFLAYLLEYLSSQGITRVVLALGYLADDVVRAFGARHAGLELSYAIEQAPLGTGGALRNALRLIEHFPVFALNGDTYLELDYRAMLRAHRDAATRLTMAVREVAESGRYGRAVIDSGRISRFEAAGEARPGRINAGVYLLADDLLADPTLPEAFSFEKDFLEPRIGTLRPLAFETNAYFIDIGVPEDYRRAQRELPTRVLKR